MGWTVRVSIPNRGKKLSSSPNGPNWLQGPPSMLLRGDRGQSSEALKMAIHLHHLVPKLQMTIWRKQGQLFPDVRPYCCCTLTSYSLLKGTRMRRVILLLPCISTVYTEQLYLYLDRCVECSVVETIISKYQ